MFPSHFPKTTRVIKLETAGADVYLLHATTRKKRGYKWD